MGKNIAGFTLILLSIICVVAIAVFGINGVKLPGVFDEGGITLGLDLAGGSTILYEADTTSAPSSEDMNTAIIMLQNRLTMLSYTEATVTSSGGKQIQVEIPGISDPEEAVRLLGASAVLEFRDNEGNVLLEGKDIKRATRQQRQDQTTGAVSEVVSVEFNSDAVEKFAKATREAAARPESENYIAIYLDDVEQSKPRVEKEINDDGCIIEGSFTQESAEYLAGIISAGRLPFNLKEVQLTAIGPVLGEKALSTSLIAGAIGIVLVIVFMIAFYRLLGVISSIALVGYVGIIGVVLVLTKANLSLPGIAGIILSIGMAVDANVVIFERIKEEARAGKTMTAAVESGFHRAFTAIIDSNITTLIAALVLWIFGTGPIVGFATTLFIGVVASMFTAITVTRLLLNRVVAFKIKNNKVFGV